jgi:benzodiazapine receptor
MLPPFIKCNISVLIPLTAGAIGSFFTVRAIPTWYALLDKPTYVPAEWIFSVVWTALYCLMGVAFFFVWLQKPSRERTRAFWFYGVTLALTALWPVVFFAMHQICLGFVIMVVVSIMAAITIVVFWRISKLAAWLFVPLLGWLLFATLLNFSIWQLN